MHAAFVGESAVSDEGLVVGQRQVGQFGDEARHVGEADELVLADGGVAQLQLQIGDDGAEIGVAAALAVSVDAALHVRGAGFHGGQRVGHRHVGIVVGVDAQDAVEALAHFGEDLDQAAGERAAVGIAEAEHVGAGVLRGFERAQGESGIGM